jgi:SAM-dependent methyltransferase
MGFTPGPMAVWRAGLASGARMLRSEPILGLKRVVLPVSYWRAVEFGFAVESLTGLPRGARVLDLGSPKDLAILCARRFGFEMTSTDIMEKEIEISRRSARAQGVAGHGAGRVHSEEQDGRALTFPADAFDAAFSISVLEHIPAEGDSAAMRELLRVVRPGGRVIVTVPYAKKHRESFVHGRVYEREKVGSAPVFFERHYDAATLASRLLGQPGSRLQCLEIWGEGAVRVERLLGRLGKLRDVVSPLEALLAAASLRRVDSGSSGHPMAAFFVVTKQAGRA